MQDPASLRALLAWLSLPGVGEKTLAAAMDHARATRVTLGTLWTSPPGELAELVGLAPRPAAALGERRAELWDAAGSLAAQLLEWDVEALTPDEPAYPARLRAAAAGPGRRRWPAVFAFGALELLDEPLVAVVNSRDAGPEAVAWTDRLADALARRDLALVTSASRESYQAVAVAGKRHGAPCVTVLDRGLATAFPGGPGAEPVAGARVWDERLDPETQLLLSPFPPRAGWTPRNGPLRDALIFDLAAAVIAVEVRPGGVMARECERAARRGTPLFALQRGGEGGGEPSALMECAAGVRPLPVSPRGELTEMLEPLLAALPAPGVTPGGQRPVAGSTPRREVRRFLLAVARAACPDRLPASLLALPERGELADLVRDSPLALAAGRGQEGRPVEVAVGEAESEQRLGELAGRLAPRGLLAAAVPAAWLRDERFAPLRAGLLARGHLLAVVELPRGDGESGETVLLYRRHGPGEESSPAAEVTVLSPGAGRLRRHEARRYLTQALGQLARRLTQDDAPRAAES